METSSRLEFCLQSWGANSYGQLGQGHVEDQSVPQLSDTATLQHKTVLTVSGGGGHSVVITGQVAPPTGLSLADERENSLLYSKFEHTSLCSAKSHPRQLETFHYSSLLFSLKTEEATWMSSETLRRRTDIISDKGGLGADIQLHTPEQGIQQWIGQGWLEVIEDQDGKVFVCGQNHKGQLGLGHNVNILNLQLCPTLNQKVTAVACGWDFTLLLTGSGQVLACGSNAFGQLGVGPTVTHSAEILVVECLRELVVSVAAGLRHSLAVNDSGCVYQWGTGLFNEAKRAFSPHPVPPHLSSKVPTLVPGMDQKTSQLVTAGLAHCACLTGDGDLFLWGSNKHGQLTTTDPFQASPTLLKHSLIDKEKVVNVWSGWTHIVAQTESGRVFTWGRADYGQLGRQGLNRQSPEEQSDGPFAEGRNQKPGFLPAEVKVLRGATQISCGSEHNLAVVGGCLFSWGWNEHGMCGDGSQTNLLQPQLIAGLRPLLIGCGAGHSVAVCATTTGSR